MNGKRVLGIVFANIHEEALDSLTAMRTMGSVPFCSRYRLIDFPLSNMVDSGVAKIGVVTNANFQSLMDHVGTGKPWDLNRKNDGLYLLPPFSLGSAKMWGNRIDAIYGNMGFLNQSNQTYVLMSDCNHILSTDYNDLFNVHEESGADITILGVKGKMPKSIGSVLCFDKVEADGRITEMSLDKDTDGDVFYSCNVMIMKKYLLETLVTAAHSKNEISYQRNIIMSNVDKLKIHAYDATDSFVGTIDSVQSYYDISMSILEKENRKKLFKHTISTKERDKNACKAQCRNPKGIHGKDKVILHHRNRKHRRSGKTQPLGQSEAKQNTHTKGHNAHTRGFVKHNARHSPGAHA